VVSLYQVQAEQKEAVMRGLLEAMVMTTAMIAGGASAQGQEARHAFEYDRKAPLDIREVGVTKRGEVTVHDILYSSPKGGRVPAYLVVPLGKGPFAAVIWGHW